MRVHKVSEENGSALYALSEPAHNFIQCVHNDDAEVNAANVVDVRDCVDIVYNYLLVKVVNGKEVFFPADNMGNALSSPVLVADPGERLSKHLITLYGNMVVLEHHLVETPRHVSDYDGFNYHPDHKL